MSDTTTPVRPLDEFAVVIRRSAEEAVARLGLREAYFDVAGLNLKVRFAGTELYEQMSPAMQHVRCAPSPTADIEITVFDSAVSGVPLPQEAGSPAGHLRQGFAQLQHREGRYVSLFEGQDRGLSVFDMQDQAGVYWLPDASKVSEGDRANPFRIILNWWLPSRGCALVHAASIGAGAGGLLLFGLSGAGKSTTSLVCFEAGFEFLADDLCAIRVEQEVKAYSVYCSAKVHEHNLQRVPKFASLVSNPQAMETEKAIGFLTQSDDGRLVSELPIRAAAVLTRKAPGSPQLKRIGPATALRSVAPPSVLNLPGPTKTLLAILAQLCSRVPCYEMQISTDHTLNPPALRALLDETAT